LRHRRPGGSDGSIADQPYDRDHSDQGSDEADTDLCSDADYHATSGTDSAAGVTLSDVGSLLDADAASHDLMKTLEASAYPST
jgi:hypothetical protein